MTEATPGIGDNSGETTPLEPPELTDEQKQALLFHHLGKVKRQKDKVASESGTLRALYKGAKADGFTKKELDFALALDGDEDDEMLDQRRKEARIARWMQHPIGSQSDLFDNQEPDRTPLVDRAFEQGKVAGMKGESCVQPYDGEAGQSWVRGWHEGQKVLHSLPLFQSGMEVIVTAAEANGEDGGGDSDDGLGVPAFLQRH